MPFKHPAHLKEPSLRCWGQGGKSTVAPLCSAPLVGRGKKRLCLNRPAWATHCCYLLLPPVIRFLGMARWSFFTALVINGAESFPSWLCYDMVAGSVAPCPQPSLGPCRVPSRCEWSTFTPTFSQSLCPLRCDKLPPHPSAAPTHTQA